MIQDCYLIIPMELNGNKCEGLPNSLSDILESI